MDSKIVYIHGRVHPPGKASPADVEVPCDEMTQVELDALDLTKVPITVDHPPDGVFVNDARDLICGEILQTTRAPDGSKYVMGWLSTATEAGAKAYERLSSGELGLSLGNRYDEARYADTNELHSRSFTPDHVSLCKNPRRPGCMMTVAGYCRSPPEYLKDGKYTATTAEGTASTVQHTVTAQTASQPVTTPPAPPAKMSTPQAAPAPAAAPQAQAQQAPAPGAPADGAIQIPAAYSADREQVHRDIIASIERVKAAEDATAEHAAKLAAMQQEMETINKERAALLKEREDAKAHALEVERKNMEKSAKTIADAYKAMRKVGMLQQEDGEMTAEDLMKSQFPNGIQTEEDVARARGLNRIAVNTNASAENGDYKRKYDELTGAAFGNAPKRLQAGNNTPMLQPSHSSSNMPSSTAAPRQSSFSRTPFTGASVSQTSAGFNQLLEQQKKRNAPAGPPPVWVCPGFMVPTTGSNK